MQSVEIKNTLAINDLENLLSKFGESHTLNLTSDVAVTSVSDGREPIPGSICFVENITNLIKVSDVIYIVPELVSGISCIVVDDPRAFFIKLLEIPIVYLKERYAILLIDKIDNFDLPKFFISEKAK